MISMIKLPRWGDVLLEISKTKERYRYCERIQKVVKCSRSHIREIVKTLEKSNLIEITPTTKIKRIELTEKGQKISIAIQTIKSELRIY